MAFTINKTDGTILATVQDGTLDQTTNLSLFGKNYAGYGELLNENQIKLLENFANTTENAPDKPIKGMLFYTCYELCLGRHRHLTSPVSRSPHLFFDKFEGFFQI